MVHEGKHPLTKVPQQYELGRFGPSSVLGCAEYVTGGDALVGPWLARMF
jgi:hypothetical protein